MYVYRLKDKKIIEIIPNVSKVKENEIHTLEGRIFSGLSNVFISNVKFNINDVIPEEMNNEMDSMKVATNEDMIKNLSKTLALLNIQIKERDVMLNTMAKTIADLNIELNKMKANDLQNL